MGYRYDRFAPGEVFHVYTRGVASKNVFRGRSDYIRFRLLMMHCLARRQGQSFSFAFRSKQQFTLTEEGDGLVDVLCYCLMTNHVHILLRENVEGGISRYIQKLLNSYAKYFNMSQERVGSLFSNPFRAVLVVSDEQLLHVSRYIHLNPYVAHMVDDAVKYEWSSLSEYVVKTDNPTCHSTLINSLAGYQKYRRLVADEADYAQSVADNEHLCIDLGY